MRTKLTRQGRRPFTDEENAQADIDLSNFAAENTQREADKSAKEEADRDHEKLMAKLQIIADREPD